MASAGKAINSWLERTVGVKVVRNSSSQPDWSSTWQQASHAIASDPNARRMLEISLQSGVQFESQLGQDAWVLNMLGSIRDGVFVDFGATDGRQLSNTWVLEKEYDWRGICAEPNPIWWDLLGANRQCSIDHRAVWTTTGDHVPFLSTIVPEIATIEQCQPKDRNAASRSQAESILVETVSLDDLVDEYVAKPVIDYLSIDTEGSELAVLNAYSWSKPIRLITVEHNYTAAKQDIDKLLTGLGYVEMLPHLSLWDAWYAHPELVDIA